MTKRKRYQTDNQKCKAKKNRQHNDQKKKKTTNTDIQIITMENKN